MFRIPQFEFDFWGHKSVADLGNIPTQIKSTMLVTLWSFIGIEGAVVMSKHAKTPQTVGRATFLGYIGCLIIYVLLSVLPYGVMDQADLASVQNPSTAGTMEVLVGRWGAWFMNIGLLISVLTSWLAWTVVTAQIPQAAAENGTFPDEFAHQNKYAAPSVSLWVTSILMQMFMLVVFFSNNAWNSMLSITSVMVLPAYLSSCAYLWKICVDSEYPTDMYIKRSEALFSGFMGVIYSLWLIYAAGLNYLLTALIFVSIGTPVYIWSKRQHNPEAPAFTSGEGIIALLLTMAALFALFAMARGIIHV